MGVGADAVRDIGFASDARVFHRGGAYAAVGRDLEDPCGSSPRAWRNTT